MNNRLQRSTGSTHRPEQFLKTYLSPVSVGLGLLIVNLACTVLVAQATDLDEAGSDQAPNSDSTAVPSFNDMAMAYPSTRLRQPTTSGAVYIGNLETRIQSLTSLLRSDSNHPAATELAALLFHRFKVLGKLADLEQSVELIDERVKVAPDDLAARRARVSILAGVHRFKAAQSDFDFLMDKGAVPEKDTLAIQLALAVGDYDKVDSELLQADRPVDDFDLSVLRGNLAMLNGRLDTASIQFFRAQQMYQGSNPYPLAWLHTQQGIALLRAGDCTQARRFFDAAVQRLPGYYLAAEHLAECEVADGDLDGARARYHAVIEQTGQPEFLGALSNLERLAGNDDLADQLADHAEAGWNALLARLPGTFDDHAVEFFLEHEQTDRAHTIAQSILARRNDVLSLALHVRTALANDLQAEACQSMAAIQKTGLTPLELDELKAIDQDCG